MKGTRHNGRSGKDGVYNPLHNDRRFDSEHSEHIDNERVHQNIYWDCYQGYTTMADRGKDNNFSFNQIEMAYYVEHPHEAERRDCGSAGNNLSAKG